MPIAAGERLGPYEILALIGAGGMGEVYKARDTRLDRIVAIKVAGEQFSERFEREARAVAALNHPHICQLYDVGPNYLVMEYIEGAPLVSPERPGPLPLEQALQYATQIAEALEAAHKKGITHRDLKPANILVTKAGGVKLLDFGLAKIASPAGPAGDQTATIALTKEHTILGTLQYMSPEQLEGQEADARSDIFAFGAVLYEMLTGRAAFEGKSPASVVSAIMSSEPPPVSSLQPLTPASVDYVVKTCLKKDPDDRWQSAREVRRELLRPADARSAPAVTRRRFPIGWIAAVAVLAAVSIGLALVHFREKPPVTEPVRFQIPLPDKTIFGNYLGISPDGRRVAFTATGPDGRNALWLRSLDSIEVRPLAGTAGMGGVPFWSPDSRLLGFGADNKLKTIDISGGPPQIVCDAKGAVVGGFWTGDGRIVFGSGAGGNGVWVVSAAGGVAAPITAVDSSHQENQHNLPSPLPDGHHFLYHRRSSRPENTGVSIGSLDTKPEAQSSQLLLASPFAAVYAPAPGQAMGRLLFLRDGTLMAQPFDVSRLALAGEPVPVAEGVGSYLNLGLFGASANGVLVYRGGRGLRAQLTWFDRQGKILGTEGDPGIYFTLALSPDATRVAVDRLDPQGNRDIWIHDTGRSAATRFTFDPALDVLPAWSPDGSHVAFSSNRDGVYNLYQKTSSGAGDDELLLKSGQNKLLSDWSRDGRFLLYSQNDPRTQFDLWVLPLAGDRKPVPLLRSEFNESQGQFSPDTHWFAYTSDETGTPEIYVRPFPPSSGGGGKWMVSTSGGTEPRWRRDGKELFYLSADGNVMSVDVVTNPVFKPGIAKALFAARVTASISALPTTKFWDVSPDGKKFLLNTPVTQATFDPSTVVLNWTAGLRK